jgi:hypothetical protein
MTDAVNYCWFSSSFLEEARSDVARGQPRERCRLSGRLTAVPTGQPTFDYKNIQDIM